MGDHSRRPQRRTTAGHHSRRPQQETTAGDHSGRQQRETTAGDHSVRPQREITAGNYTEIRRPQRETTAGNLSERPAEDENRNVDPQNGGPNCSLKTTVLGGALRGRNRCLAHRLLFNNPSDDTSRHRCGSWTVLQITTTRCLVRCLVGMLFLFAQTVQSTTEKTVTGHARYDCVNR